jgi:putative peptide zinc metalloprotease protein
MIPQKEPEALKLPAMREELQIEHSASMFSGAPGWLIIDPIRHRYFKIEQEIFELLALWHKGTAEKLIDAARTTIGRVVDREDIAAVIKFLHVNSLTLDPPSDNWKSYLEQDQARQRSAFGKMLHNYLFFRIPLVRPEGFLRASFPFVRFLFTKTAVISWVFLTLLGLYLTSRQWNEFTSTFLHFLSFNGILLWLGSLVFVKTIHELGHAYMCKHYGLKVPVMGIAFMVLMPVLYTDTSSAWRLQNPKSRLMIDAGGIFAELGLAGVATLFWVFLPEGGAKSVAFTIATTSWIFSLLVNLNPFMRFDGYYLLSDALDVSNLQQRSFAMARWKLREMLFKLGTPPPEYFSKSMSAFLIIHAWGTWIYRFFLFLGIALLVYAFFIKVLGIILFTIEIAFFILLPIFREIKQWWAMKDSIMKTKRTLITSSLFIGLMVLAFYPFNATVKIPAVLEPKKTLDLYVPAPAKLQHIYVKEGQYVEKGTPLFLFHSDLIAQHIHQSLKRIELLKLRLNRIAANHDELQESNSLRAQLTAEEEKIKGYKRQLQVLKITAPISGVVKDLDRMLQSEQWASPKLRLATIAMPEHWHLRGYVIESDLFQIEKNLKGKFIADDPFRPQRSVQVTKIGDQGEEALEIKELSSIWGGAIASERDDKDRAASIEAAYQVNFNLEGKIDDMPNQITRGVVLLKGKPISFATKLFRQVSKIMIREIGF